MHGLHVWIRTRQSKDAYEQSWILWNVVGYKSTSEVEMTAYIRTWESCNGLAMPTSLKDFLQGNMQHTHKKFNSCLKSSILKITGFLPMLSYFMWNFHPKKKQQQPCYPSPVFIDPLGGAGCQRSRASIRFQGFNQPQRGHRVTLEWWGTKSLGRLSTWGSQFLHGF